MTRSRLCLAVACLVALEALWFATRPAGERLRPLVDLFAVEGLVLALGGAFLAADRPFLAAREIAGRLRGRGDDDSLVAAAGPEPRPRLIRADRSFGLLTLLLGGALFGIAALLWAVCGTT